MRQYEELVARQTTYRAPGARSQLVLDHEASDLQTARQHAHEIADRESLRWIETRYVNGVSKFIGQMRRVA